MQIPTNPIVCDGCARPASPDHIAERLARLERATRFRPVHINVLFVALAPTARPEDDFYGPPQSNIFYESLMDALDITPPAGDAAAHLPEFQRKGYYLAYLSECPIPGEQGSEAAAISALSPALIRRIRFNYKPKHIALLGNVLAPLIEILQKSGLGPLLLLDQGKPLSIPVTADLSARAGFRSTLRTALSTGASSENRLSDYDRMQCKQA
ncbi:MAG: hypothetical protein LAO08_16575 [Acidobacteriia bacterium]|nr:hypothetical protein [Terriglobia bacterium]